MTDEQPIAAAQASAPSPHAVLSQQIQEVQAYAKSHPNLTLVLGDTTDNFLGGFKKYDDSYVFLDDCHTKALPGRKLSANFNSLTDLDMLASQLGHTFSRILLDHNTYHHTEWSIDHLNRFRALLKPQGVFQFEMTSTSVHVSECVAADINDYKERVASELLQRFAGQRLQRFSFVRIEPENLQQVPVIPVGAQKSVEDKAQLYHGLAQYALTRDESERLMFGDAQGEEAVILEAKAKAMREQKAKIGLASEPRGFSKEELEDIAGLRTEFTFELLSKRMQDAMFQDVYLPHTKNLLLKVFSRVESATEAYPQYPDEHAIFFKAMK
jgi:hypothetical protein